MVNFDKPLSTPEPDYPTLPAEIELPEEDISPEEGALPSGAFADNLAETLFSDDNTLLTMATDLIQLFDADKRSRSDWEQAYVKGLEYLGMKTEERSEPWEGACGVYHPLLTEAVVRFQSQAITEIFPAPGPARTKIMGRQPEEKVQQAQRIEDEMNYILTEKMTEYRNETEQVLFRLPLVGSVLRKVYYDPTSKRPQAIMVPAEDFVINYGSSDLKSGERYTHVMKRTKNELKKMMATGFYRTLEIQEPSPVYSKVDEAHDKISGRTPTMDTDTRHTILEFHTDYDLGEHDYACPYIITIEQTSQKVLGIRRNWREGDESYQKRIHFAHYQYMPGMGFYGTGLVHLIGGLARSATSILRQLVDSGTLANLPAGFKTKGLKVKNDGDPLHPGEFRDVDVASGALKDNIIPLPIKEPSQTLYSLLNTIVDEGRRIASIADLDVGDMNQQAPVGTTLALLERSMKIMSAVHARLHAALKEELKLIAEIVGTQMPPQYDWDPNNEFNRQEDFSDRARIEIIPVSDPNSSTMAQRVVQYQAVYQMAQTNPELYNMPMLHRKGLEALQMKELISHIPH